ncbi:MAG TPA: metal-dependent hydrolase [Candidatus Woesearchaeota archaeon]|nr:metal-dependent hydrolase [Candidatus Woesearchaeota archaeon]
MKLYTHLLFSILLLTLAILIAPVLNNSSLLQEFFNPLFSPIYFLFYIIGSIFPDIDIANSYINKKLKIPIILTKINFRHRGLFHSLMIPLILSLLSLIFQKQPFISLVLISFSFGMISHIILDSLTPAGVSLFWPFPIKIKGTIKTSSLKETLLFITMLIILIVIWLVILRV